MKGINKMRERVSRVATPLPPVTLITADTRGTRERDDLSFISSSVSKCYIRKYHEVASTYIFRALIPTVYKVRCSG